jgi:uncharacterized protein (DUF1499 family)
MNVGSLTAPAVILVGVLSVLALTAIGLRLGLLPPLAGFAIFNLVWIGGGITALVLGLIRLRSAESRPGAMLMLALALLLLAPALRVLPGLRAPRIHDLTTSPDDPPRFTVANQAPGNRGRDLTYPHGGANVPALQATGYPELRPARVSLAPEQALDAAVEVAERLGWEVTWVNRERATIEATDTSTLFRFVDDVVVRITPDGAGSRIDLRSVSRVGQSDLGANAARIAAFVQAIER